VPELTLTLCVRVAESRTKQRAVPLKAETPIRAAGRFDLRARRPERLFPVSASAYTLSAQPGISRLAWSKCQLVIPLGTRNCVQVEGLVDREPWPHLCCRSDMRVAWLTSLLFVLGSCSPASSPEARFTSAEPCDGSPVVSARELPGATRFGATRFRWSGSALAGPAEVDHLVGSKGQFWILAIEPAPRTTIITAERLGSATRTAFEVWRYYANDGSIDPVVLQLPNGSTGTVYAAVGGGPKLYEPGCWRVELAHGGSVTIPVR